MTPDRRGRYATLRSDVDVDHQCPPLPNATAASRFVEDLTGDRQRISPARLRTRDCD